MLSSKKFAEGIAAVARAFGIWTKEGRLLLTAESVLAIFLIASVSLFSVEHMLELLIAAVFRRQTPHPYQWDAFYYGLKVVGLSLVFVLIREVMVRRSDS